MDDAVVFFTSTKQTTLQIPDVLLTQVTVTLGQLISCLRAISVIIATVLVLSCDVDFYE